MFAAMHDLVPEFVPEHDINIHVAILSARLSVRHVPVFCRNDLTYCHSFFHCTIAQSFYFYEYQTSSLNSNRITPCGGAKTRGISRFDFRLISRYISQTIQGSAIVTIESE